MQINVNGFKVVFIFKNKQVLACVHGDDLMWLTDHNNLVSKLLQMGLYIKQ